ncbi:phenylalanine--tRNA ligase subunit beta [Nitrospirillum sp. BR 11163]|uniref:phenylalanine--tRNA ligase subunit beta n=1 Tax=Nitrospirillum sp. BR 11163 TaxID=3104323 RepID=UPI002AFE1389|nr:phenylalanine--tRNA ligase subunit beta [Nitrospirillum sp. BR 11163]MEA1675418.1 phenylalanine--tRNA ligase subunit beta [Nitrospirillum sp. BR 11163]
MKFTLSWLKQHLETDAPLDVITDKLTALGLEVEGVEDTGKALAPFVIAKVLSAEKHPNADKLRVAMVDTGTGEPIQVVCGAPNCRAGITVVFASPGAVVPATGDTLKVGAIRGVESRGMLCSERELNLSDEHNGIIELPEEAPVGASFAAWRKLDDAVIEISLTPDRVDCAGVYGIARDLAAAGVGALKPLNTAPVPGVFPAPVKVALETAACPQFAARVVRGVRNGPSPQWLQDKLTAVGLRPISALVDITNLMTLDQVRPLHVFDAAKVQGDLTVRESKAGETLLALNGKEYTLPAGLTVIADASGSVLSLGGVMGGESTGVSETTTDVIIEAALFEPAKVAETGRALQIDSDARYRFERGVDPASVVSGIEQATRLVLDLCGGEAGEVFVAGAEPAWRRPLTLRPARVAHLGGVDVAEADQIRILSALGFETSRKDGLIHAVPPSWRADVHGEADLVEEVLRIHGFDAIPTTSLPRDEGLPKVAVTPKQRRTATVRRLLAGRGMLEAITWSFLAPETAQLFGGAPDELALLNPISADLAIMRPSVLANLAAAAGRNAARGYADLALFEVGPAFRDGSEKGQDLIAAGVRAGLAVARHWAKGTRPVDAYDAKADAIAALEAAGAPTANLVVSTDAPGWYHPGRSGCLRLGPTVLARFGELHPAVLEALDLTGPLVAFEVFLDLVPQPKKKGGTEKPKLDLSTFQPISRDFAFVVEAGVEADRLIRAAKGADKALITGVQLFDVYQGPGVETGFKSIALSVTLQPVDKTLTDAEIEAVAAKVVAAVTKATGAVLRG